MATLPAAALTPQNRATVELLYERGKGHANPLNFGRLSRSEIFQQRTASCCRSKLGKFSWEQSLACVRRVLARVPAGYCHLGFLKPVTLAKPCARATAVFVFQQLSQ